MSLAGATIEFLLLPYGPIPPSGGPHRQRFLEHYGTKALDTARRELAAAYGILDIPEGGFPSPPTTTVEHSEEARVRLILSNKASWSEAIASIDGAVLRAVEPHVRAAVRSAIDALNYLEDHDLAEEAHAEVHRAAFLQCGLFGCPISFMDGQFRTRCPIELSHLRIGASAELVSDFECTICNQLVEDCEHNAGDFYGKPAARDGDNRCNICGTTECGHPPGQIVLVRAEGIARNIKQGAMAFVSRPRYPTARAVSKVVDIADSDFAVCEQAATNGMLHCRIDLGPCSGLEEIPDLLSQ